MISNELLNDKNISLKAKGVYAFMYSKPDDFNFTIKSMSKLLLEGQRAIMMALQELKDNGWISYSKNTDGSGIYHLTDEPNIDFSNKEIPKHQNPNIENSNLTKQQSFNNKELTNNTNCNNTHDVKSDLFSNSEITVIPISIEILKYLNKVKPSKIPFEFSKTNLTHIEARIKEKFKEDDFKKVIDHKVLEWKDNPKMKKYIRPETLFGDKFNGYLVEAHETKSDGSGNFQFNPTSKAELL